MKNMKKFITLCGFLILGSIACGDADVVKAEAINEQTTDTSGYTITIPSEISVSTDTTNLIFQPAQINQHKLLLQLVLKTVLI